MIKSGVRVQGRNYVYCQVDVLVKDQCDVGQQKRVLDVLVE